MSELGVPTSTTEAPTDNDRLWGALAYLPIIWPILPIIMLLMEENKKRVFQRFHAIQSIALGIVIWVLFIIVAILVSVVTLGLGALCVPILVLVPLAIQVYYMYLAYQGKYAEVPYLTKFLRDQKWI